MSDSKLGKAYQKYEDNGGEIAITGFNFQAYSGMYFMLFLHKNNYNFEIEFEKVDDIILKNLTTNKKFKIQVKSNKASISGITKEKNEKSILGKLLFGSEEFDYKILTFGLNSMESLKKQLIKKEGSENILGTNLFYIENNDNKIAKFLKEADYSLKSVIFQEIPFVAKDTNNCVNYLVGFSLNSNDVIGESLKMTHKQIYAILGSIYNVSTKTFSISKLDNSIFVDFGIINKYDEILNDLLKDFSSFKKNSYIGKLKRLKGEYDKNKKIYDNIFKQICVEKFQIESEDLKIFYDKYVNLLKSRKEYENWKKKYGGFTFSMDWCIINHIIRDILEEEL